MRVETHPTAYVCIENCVALHWHTIAILTGVIALSLIGSTNALILAAVAGTAYAAWKLLAGKRAPLPAVIELRSKILILSKPLLMDETKWRAWDCTLEQKLSATVPEGKDAKSQMQLDAMYPKYLEVVRQIRPNLRSWFELGQTFLQQIETATTFEAVQEAQKTFQTKFASVFQRHRELEGKIKEFEDSIIPQLKRS